MVQSRVAEALRLTYEPVALLFSHERPEGAQQFKDGAHFGCVVALLATAAKGRTVCFDRAHCPCPGGRTGLGFGQGYLDFPGGIEQFLSTGAGEGFREGECYWRTPALAQSFVDSLPIRDVPYEYVVAKPLAEVDLETETPQVVIFLANPDQLSALTVLTHFGRPAGDHVRLPMGAGCHSVGIFAFHEADQDCPRAVVGLVDISARPMVAADVLSFTVPWRMYLELEANVAGSFLEKEAWHKVARRLPEPRAAA